MTAPTHPRIWGLLALALWAGYALPLFVPPAADCAATLAADAGLLQRVFPGVPAWWVGLRIACLLAATAIIAAMTYRDLPAALPVQPQSVPPVRIAVWIALALAAAQLVFALWVEQFERRGQFFYLVALLAPTGVLFVSYHRRARSAERRLLLSLAAIAAVWAAVRLALAWDSPRSADAVDMLSAVTFLEQTDNAGLNILTSALGPMRGVSYLFLVFHGAGLYGPEGLVTRTLHLLQIIDVIWTGVVAVGLGWIAARAFGRAAAGVAAATFLFSPFMLLGALTPTPLYYAVLVATGLIVLWLRIHERRSPPAIAAFGTLAGVGCSHPGTLPFTVCIAAAALWSAQRAPKLPFPLVAVGLLCFAAAVYPGLPTLTALRSMQQSYTRATIPWTPLEAAVSGQVPPPEAQQMLYSGGGREIDIVAGAVLAPAAIPRTAIRLWGDALFDPVGAGLAIGAIAASVLAVRRSALARAMLALLVVAMLPAILSSYDRTSIVRMAILPTMMALFAGLGFELIRRRYVATWRPLPLAVAVTASAALAGVVLFDVVTPRLVRGSAFGIALEAMGRGAPLDDVAFLDHREWEFNWLGRIGQTAEVIRNEPVRVVRYASADDLAGVEAVHTGTRLLFWTPGLEAYHAIERHICSRWPQARIYTLVDRPGCSRVFAALLSGGEAWRPALPSDRWSAHGCST